MVAESRRPGPSNAHCGAHSTPPRLTVVPRSDDEHHAEGLGLNERRAREEEARRWHRADGRPLIQVRKLVLNVRQHGENLRREGLEFGLAQVGDKCGVDGLAILVDHARDCTQLLLSPGQGSSFVLNTTDELGRGGDQVGRVKESERLGGCEWRGAPYRTPLGPQPPARVWQPQVLA